ncbi:MAG: sulfur carrier protein ThiS adenylyltransferase ThiF, partial [Emergencia timonensis]
MIPTKEEIQRTLEQRHTKTVQDKLSAAKAAVCGLGGLGSAIAIALARTGIGQLHLIDFDRVDLANLNRQQYAVCDLDRPKPEALRDEILRFSPYCKIRTDFVKLTEENIPSLLSEDEYICEAFDVAEEKAMLTNCILEKLPRKYLVGASGMAGYGDS